MNASARRQHGAALAVALLILVVITLLGVAAVRATQTELKLAQNSESRMTAVQSAQSMVSLIPNELLPVNGDENFRACYRPSPDGNALRTPLFTCAPTDAEIPLTAAPVALQDFGYLLVRREQPLFVQVNVLRDAATSAKTYDFARFTITGGYDRSGDGLSAAEITEGQLRLHTKIAGVNYE